MNKRELNHMKFLNKIFPSKEHKRFLAHLDSLEVRFDNPAFKIVRERLMRWAVNYPSSVKKLMNEKIDHDLWIIGQISNISGDLVESGEYHMYRGVLNPMREGPDLLKLFDQSTDLACSKGEFDEEFAKKQKSTVRRNMRSVG